MLVSLRVLIQELCSVTILHKVSAVPGGGFIEVHHSPVDRSIPKKLLLARSVCSEWVVLCLVHRKKNH